MNKISRYFSTLEITRGFLVALLGSVFIYLEHEGHTYSFLITIFGISSLTLLMASNKKIWLISGFFTGIFWFWWIALSFEHYHMIWAIPLVVIAMGLLYAVIFWSVAWVSEKITKRFTLTPSGNTLGMHASLFTLTLKALGLLVLSYIHPFGFDWFKPELMFVNSYIGIEKWQFTLVLVAIILTIWKNNFLFLFLILLAYQPTSKVNIPLPEEIDIVTMHTSVEDKWNKTLHQNQFKDVLQTIDHAIDQKKRLIILPESVFPVFLNYKLDLLAKLERRAKHISIVVGGLHWDGKTPHNSTYIFTNGKIAIANKVLLVPFGESNPLPDFLSDWVNKVFYDGAVDYKASENVVDYSIDGVIYRNAICFEATSERLYAKDVNNLRPKNMIVLSNNGWFTPSIEPTLQKLLLQYYSKKYGTTIYHSVNMSSSYIIQSGQLLSP